jgi:hypothetical protein
MKEETEKERERERDVHAKYKYFLNYDSYMCVSFFLTECIHSLANTVFLAAILSLS